MARAWQLLAVGRLDDMDRWLTAADTAANSADAVALRDIAVLRAVHRFKIGDQRVLLHRTRASSAYKVNGERSGLARCWA